MNWNMTRSSFNGQCFSEHLYMPAPIFALGDKIVTKVNMVPDAI